MDIRTCWKLRPSIRRCASLLTFFAPIGFLATSCAAPKVLPPTAAVPPHSWYWVDLRPGWRVRIVTPVIKSGGYPANRPTSFAGGQSVKHAQSQDHTPGATATTLKTGKDFTGYEVSFYSAKAERGGGVRVAFKSAVVYESGRKKEHRHPIVRFFQLPPGDQYVRILHLAVGNHGDHDAAILAAAGREVLGGLTNRVEADSSACVVAANSYCSWIPAGIAVIPERKGNTGGKRGWTAAY